MLPGFWQWLYSEGLGQTAAIYQSLVLLTYDFFSISILLRTLFAPWRRDEVAPTTPSIQLIFQAFWNNLIARFIGAIVRTIVIIFGSIITIGVILGGALGLILVATFPISVPGLLIIGIILLTNLTFSLVAFGIVLIASAVAIAIFTIQTYFKNRWRDQPPATPLSNAVDQKLDLDRWLTRTAADCIEPALPVAEYKKALAATQPTKFILARIGMDQNFFCANPLPAEVTRQLFLRTASQAALKENHSRITLGDLVIAVFTLDSALQQALVNYDLALEDVYNIVDWQERFWQILEPENQLLSPKKLKFFGGIGKDWATGYTNYLDRFSHDMTQEVANPVYDLQFIAHKNQIDEIERILARSGKHNVLLIGETGIGKRTLVYGFARQVLTGKTLAPLVHKRILELDLTSLLGSAQSGNELEASLIKVLNEAVRAGNVILFVDDIERIVNQNDEKLGTTNAVQILIPYLQSSDLQLIATTLPSEYHKSIERQPNLAATFEKIEMNEPTEQETLRVLQEIAPAIEAKHRVIATYQGLRHLVKQAARYMGERKFPEKAIDLLDEVAVDVATHSSNKIISPEAIDAVLSQKTNAPIGAVGQDEKTVLLDLENLLHQRVVNQTQAIAAIANALRRSRAGVGSEKKPIGSFLFLGPTGVGKTETAKALCEVIFRSETAMIRVDMSEFQELTSIRRLIGDETQGSGGVLTDSIREKPFTVVLLDEIEKAHPKILDLFLQLLDEGRLTDALGQVADFRNAIIIATSNAGANIIRQAIVQQGSAVDMEAVAKQLLDTIQNNNTFRPEFLNRFDAVVAYRPLTVDELMQVVDRQLALINQRLSERQITVTMADAAKRKLAQLGFDPAYGARALTRAMAETVENQLAEVILKEQLQKGGSFEVTQEMIK